MPTTAKTTAPKVSSHKPITDREDIINDIEVLEDLLNFRDGFDEERFKKWLGVVANKTQELLDDVRCLRESGEMTKTGLLDDLMNLKKEMVAAGVECGKIDEAMGVVLEMFT